MQHWQLVIIQVTRKLNALLVHLQQPRVLQQLYHALQQTPVSQALQHAQEIQSKLAPRLMVELLMCMRGHARVYIQEYKQDIWIPASWKKVHGLLVWAKGLTGRSGVSLCKMSCLLSR
jgi:hypothetical protein